jgi:hypothetical protein
MYVKMLTGHKAGEVIDLRSDVALEFIRLKQAERAFQESPVSDVPVVAAKAAEPPAKPAKHSRRAK